MQERVLTNAMLETYMNFLREEEKSAATLEKYERDIRKFLRYADHRLVSKELVMAYKEALKEHYEATSINSMLAALNKLFDFYGWKDCRVRRLRIQHRTFCDQTKELKRAEYSRLIQASKRRGQEQINLIIQTICGTGIRVSELKYITTTAVKERRAVVECKGKIRTIFLPKKLSRMLGQYIKKKQIKKGAVFVTRTGNPIDRSNIWRGMKALCDTAEVSHRKVFPHNLRHLFAYTFYQAEKDLAKLADILGHSSVETTRCYMISSGGEHSRLVDRLGLVC